MPEEDLRTRFAGATGLRLHLGGWEAKHGWTIVNIEERPGVDVLGSCTDLSMFPDGSVAEIYASHVYEHLGYQQELPTALREAYRTLMPGGNLMISVPDLDVLCSMFLQAANNLDARFFVQRMMMGGQMDSFDFHKTGFSLDILGAFLAQHGFTNIRRVRTFGLFKDTSEMVVGTVPISLNVQCMKPTAAK